MLNCHLNCPKVAPSIHGHYHCTCGSILTRKHSMIIHVSKGKEHVTKPSLLKSLTKEPRVLATSVNLGKHGPCDTCGHVMLRKNISRHMRDVHKSSVTNDILPACLVSASEGLFMVSQSCAGNQHPLHVQLCVSASSQTISCESKGCIEASKAYSRGSVSSFCCKHILAAQACKEELNFDTVTTQNIERAVEDKLLTSSNSHHLESHICLCRAKGILPVIGWQINTSSDYVYFSVFTKEDKHYARYGRVVVRYSKKSLTFDCPCVTGKKGCLHKKLAMVHAYAHYRDDFKEMDTGNESKDTRHDVNTSDTAKCNDYSDYVLDKKVIPVDIEAYYKSSMPTALVPSEKSCPVCSNLLSSPQLITRVGRIYDIDNVSEGEDQCKVYIDIIYIM